MRSVVVVVACVLASLLWLVCFAVGARAMILMPVLAVGGCTLIIIIFAFLKPVRERLHPHVRDLLWGVGVGGVTLAFTYALYPAVKHFFPAVAADVVFLYKLVPVTRGTLPIVALVVVAEELLWRGALLDALRADHRAVSAIVLASALYGAAQLGLGVPVLALAALVLGAVWAVEAAFTGGLVAPLVSHAIWTITVFGIVPLERTTG